MVHCPSSVVVQIWSRVWNLSCPDSKPGLIHSFTNSLLTAILSRAQNGHTIIRKTQYFSWDLVQDLDLDWVWTKLKFFLKIRPDSAQTRICNASGKDWNVLESGPSLDEFSGITLTLFWSNLSCFYSTFFDISAVMQYPAVQKTNFEISSDKRIWLMEKFRGKKTSLYDLNLINLTLIWSNPNPDS